MKRALVVFSLVLLVASIPAAIVYAWTTQNAYETAQLGLDLARFGAWRMQAPMQVTALMGAAFGAGFALATLLFGVWGLVHRLRAGQADRYHAL